MSQFIQTCPACGVRTLERAELQPLLPCFRCPRCAGQWIRGEHYFRWLEHPDRKHTDVNPNVVGEPHDSKRAMICPECGKLLSRYRVGHGVSFSIDRCAGCGGIWLDANEWETLQQHHLEDRIHMIFSTAWQGQILREEQQKAFEQRLVSRIGDEHFAELKRVVAWVDTHPHRAEIAAFLLQHLRALEPPKAHPLESP